MQRVRRGVSIAVAVCSMVVLSVLDAGAQVGKTPDGKWSAQVTGGVVVAPTASASGGVELGWWPTSNFKVLVESNWMSNVASADLDARAKVIADAIGGTADMKQFATVVDVGLRYAMRAPTSWRPFVLAGFGVARVNTKPSFAVGGKDVTGSLLSTYGARLGLDLDGHVSKAALVLGAGVSVPLTSRYFIEGSARYGRIFPRGDLIPGDSGTNTQRIEVSAGARF